MILRPMKGVQVEDSDYDRLVFPFFASPKIDGFRCVLAHHPLTSRLSRFPNEHFHRTMSGILHPGDPLDSEVVVGSRRGPDTLSRTSSGLTSREGIPDFRLWCFDRPSVEAGFEKRYRELKKLIRDLDRPEVRYLRHTLIESLSDFELFLATRLELGYEGIMIRSVDGPYKNGKSTLMEHYLLKVKPFESFEARITGYYEEMENTNEAKREATGKLKRSSSKKGKKAKGTLGGFLGEVVNPKTLKSLGIPVRVGGGFTARQRKDFWAIRDELVAAGAIMECTKQKTGEKDRPRHPNFRRLRPRWDVAG